ncbi:MAG: stage II sporulation protein M [Tannerella sp.]|nr:stage II sporulation protein M [Tannerella sp.]
MKEISFIRQHIEKWKTLESVVDRASEEHPERLVNAYLEITADLSFSRSHYPHSRITVYLNNLASALHHSLYRTGRESGWRIVTFWTTELPRIMYASRKELRYSLLVFLISASIGCLSTLNDDMFPRLILGNSYIDMTVDNIERGDPMAVYGDMSPVPMFFYIMMNNVRVSFVIFLFGLLTGFGTGAALFYNGVMIGTFQTFCFQQQAGLESLLAIWLHGTLEISAVVVAGAAGFALGNGWLFPGTYPRGYAFRQGAVRGLKIVVGTTPVFILAAFIESFLTRHTGMPDAVRGGFILLTLAFVLFYYIYLPKRLNHEHPSKPKNPVLPDTDV